MCWMINQAQHYLGSAEATRHGPQGQVHAVTDRQTNLHALYYLQHELSVPLIAEELLLYRYSWSMLDSGP